MFSVVIPVYNGEKFIVQAVESVIAQTNHNWEIVIVNDGSTDGTLTALEKYAGNDNIRVISQPNGGVSAARNTGINAAKGEYIAFLDCDDLWRPEHLAEMQKMIDAYPDAGLYATLVTIRFADGKTYSNKAFFNKKEKTVYLEDFYDAYNKDKHAKTYSPSSVCITREAAQKAGGFKVGCKIGEDLAYYMVISAYFPVVLSREETAVYERGNSVATKDISFDPDWYFFDEVGSILADETINETKRKNLAKVMQWFVMRRCRHYLIDGRRKEAVEAYKEIGNDPALFFDKLITACLLLLPTWLTKKIFILRWRHKG